MKNVVSEGETRRQAARKRSLLNVNEHSELAWQRRIAKRNSFSAPCQKNEYPTSIKLEFMLELGSLYVAFDMCR